MSTKTSKVDVKLAACTAAAAVASFIVIHKINLADVKALSCSMKTLSVELEKNQRETVARIGAVQKRLADTRVEFSGKMDLMEKKHATILQRIALLEAAWKFPAVPGKLSGASLGMSMEFK